MNIPLAAGDVGQAIVLIVLIVLSITGNGLFLARLARFAHSNCFVLFATGCGAGTTLLGFEMLALGYLDGFRPSPVILCLLAGCAGNFLLPMDWCRERLARLRAGFTLTPLNAVLLAMSSLTLVAIFISGLRPGFQSDELGYQWSAPLLWASNHHWTPSPFRFTNGAVLIQLLYTISAVFGNQISGHWTHSVLFAILLIACCALASTSIPK